MSELYLLGIRHHGPGSARAVERALEHLKPDCVLIEGPPEATSLLSAQILEGLTPPVALLAYTPQEPGLSLFWPYSEFSPEWRAMRYALSQGVSCELIDLPVTHTLAQKAEERAEERAQAQGEGHGGEVREEEVHEEEVREEEEQTHPRLAWAQEMRADPLGYLATLAQEGALPEEDERLQLGDRWWERLIEGRGELSGEEALSFFGAVEEVMSVMRAELNELNELTGSQEGADVSASLMRERLREASMRKLIKKHSKGKERVAVVCGAWHVPALRAKVKAGDDNALLKGLPKSKVTCTWTPWSERRLSSDGYGAGLLEPAWGRYLWRYPCANERAERWLVDATRLLREGGFHVASAHAIEAARLATALSALRGSAGPELSDLLDALISSFGLTEGAALSKIKARLISGVEVGVVPSEHLDHPLLKDVALNNKRFKLKQAEATKVTKLDLRKPLHQDKSAYLHRLRLLGLGWATPEQRFGSALASTAFESWSLSWAPEMVMRLIEAGGYGDSVEEASQARVTQLAQHGRGAYDPPSMNPQMTGVRGGLTLSALSELLSDTLKARLDGALPALLRALSDEAALSDELSELLDALPQLIWTHRYQQSAVGGGDVSLLPNVISQLLPRLFVALPEATMNLSEEREQALISRLSSLHRALMTSGDQPYLSPHREGWRACLSRVAERDNTSPQVSGLVTRLLFDQGWWGEGAVFQRARLSLSVGDEPERCARWLEGFLSGGGLMLVYHERLRSLIDRWVCSLTPEAFHALLPLLRRTFSAFSYDENRQLSEALQRDEFTSAEPTSELPSELPSEGSAGRHSQRTHTIAGREISQDVSGALWRQLSWLSRPPTPLSAESELDDPPHTLCTATHTQETPHD